MRRIAWTSSVIFEVAGTGYAKGCLGKQAANEECILVAVNQLIESIRLFVEEDNQIQRAPVPLFFNEHLTAFKTRAVTRLKTAELPNWVIGNEIDDIWPEQRTCFLILGPIEQLRGIPHRHLVRIEQEDLLEPRVQDGVRLKLPAIRDSHRMLRADSKRVDPLDVEIIN
jgi:hypothetical protein